MNDALLDKLGNYFVKHRIRQRYNITFEQVVNKYVNGDWN